MPRIEVVVLVACTTFHSDDAVSVGTTPHIHGVPMTVIALAWKISLGMAIDASRVMEHRDHGFKSSGGGSIITRRRSVNVIVLGWLIARQGRASQRTECQGASHHDNGDDYRIFLQAHLLVTLLNRLSSTITRLPMRVPFYHLSLMVIAR
jgi:hypothetical protein